MRSKKLNFFSNLLKKNRIIILLLLLLIPILFSFNNNSSFGDTISEADVSVYKTEFIFNVWNGADSYSALNGNLSDSTYLPATDKPYLDYETDRWAFIDSFDLFDSLSKYLRLNTNNNYYYLNMDAYGVVSFSQTEGTLFNIFKQTPGVPLGLPGSELEFSTVVNFNNYFLRVKGGTDNQFLCISNLRRFKGANPNSYDDTVMSYNFMVYGLNIGEATIKDITPSTNITTWGNPFYLNILNPDQSYHVLGYENNTLTHNIPAYQFQFVDINNNSNNNSNNTRKALSIVVNNIRYYVYIGGGVLNKNTSFSSTKFTLFNIFKQSIGLEDEKKLDFNNLSPFMNTNYFLKAYQGSAFNFLCVDNSYNIASSNPGTYDNKVMSYNFMFTDTMNIITPPRTPTGTHTGTPIPTPIPTPTPTYNNQGPAAMYNQGLVGNNQMYSNQGPAAMYDIMRGPAATYNNQGPAGNSQISNNYQVTIADSINSVLSESYSYTINTIENTPESSLLRTIKSYYLSVLLPNNNFILISFDTYSSNNRFENDSRLMIGNTITPRMFNICDINTINGQDTNEYEKVLTLNDYTFLGLSKDVSRPVKNNKRALKFNLFKEFNPGLASDDDLDWNTLEENTEYFIGISSLPYENSFLAVDVNGMLVFSNPLEINDNIISYVFKFTSSTQGIIL